ncbi:MAG: hypothetical protein RMJ33_03030 [Saprospiraceae bacterium]|nr:hypothetical protein [Saprospiraceae bacterium]MDW8228790.1 hypothetical protein [Saprospiraceae bacterium]
MKSKKFLWVVIGSAILMLVLVTAVPEAWGQCPMCRMSAESNLQNGGTAGRGLNTGILYMLAMPYLLVAAIGYWWWRNRRKSSVEADELLMDRPGQQN